MSLVLALGATVLLTRILRPSGYGQFAAGLAIYAYLFLIAQLGINAYLLRRPDNDPAAYATARTLLMATGLIAFGIGALAMPWLERWLGGVGVSTIAMWLLAGLPLQLLMLVSLAALERSLDYRAVAAAELVGIVLMYSLSVLLAWQGYGPKSMVIGWWVQQVVMFIWLQRASGQPFRFGFDRAIAKQTLAYGGSYAVSVWTLQLRELVNPLIVGRWLGLESVAVVAIAVRLVEAASFVKAAAWRLALPALARLQNTPAKLGAAVTEGMRLQILVVGPMLLALVLVTPWVVPWLFGDQWLAVRTILPLIAAGTLTGAMFNLHSSALFAMGRNREVLAFNFIFVLLFAFAAFRLVPLTGVGGYGIAELMALPAYISIFLALRRATERPAQGVELTLGLFFVIALAGSAWDPRWAFVALVPLVSAAVRAGIRDTYSTLRGALLVALVVAVLPTGVLAQETLRPEDARAGSMNDRARYLRALELAGGGNGPWTADSASSRFALRAVNAAAGANSGLPSTREEGTAWSGRGLNLRTSVLATGTFGLVSVRLEPVLWWVQNQSFPLVATAVASPPSPFSDPQRPRGIDLPQRFGPTAFAQLDAGESEVALTWRGARVALTSASRAIGPGTYHNLVMQGDAGGFPRLEIGTAEGIRTPIGTFSAVLASGRIAQTSWAPAERTGARHGSFFEGRWQPLGDSRLELGGVRFYHRDWQGIRPKDLLVPFGSLFFDEQINADGDADNQLGSVFANVRIPSAGLEFFAEFGKNDRSVDIRDFAVELEQNSAWLLGVQKAWRDAEERLWTVNVTGVSGRIPSIDLFRSQATFYEHTPISQGHTVRGQLLGTPLLERTGGGELRVDRYDTSGRLAAIVSTRSLPNRQAAGVSEQFLRQEWSVWLESLRFTSRGSYFARLGGIADLGRDPVRGDSYSLSVSVGYTHRR